MEPNDIAIEILKDIRTEVRSTNGRLDETDERLDTMRLRPRVERCEQDISELKRRLP